MMSSNPSNVPARCGSDFHHWITHPLPLLAITALVLLLYNALLPPPENLQGILFREWVEELYIPRHHSSRQKIKIIVKDSEEQFSGSIRGSLLTPEKIGRLLEILVAASKNTVGGSSPSKEEQSITVTILSPGRIGRGSITFHRDALVKNIALKNFLFLFLAESRGGIKTSLNFQR